MFCSEDQSKPSSNDSKGHDTEQTASATSKGEAANLDEQRMAERPDALIHSTKASEDGEQAPKADMKQTEDTSEATEDAKQENDRVKAKEKLDKMETKGAVE